MTGHVCMDVRDMCAYCESRAEDAYEGGNESEPIGWEP